jgi:hypothetical protein
MWLFPNIIIMPSCQNQHLSSIPFWPVGTLALPRWGANLRAAQPALLLFAGGGLCFGQQPMFCLFVNMMHLVVIEEHLADSCVCSQRATLLCALSICRLASCICIYLVAQRLCWSSCHFGYTGSCLLLGSRICLLKCSRVAAFEAAVSALAAQQI